MNCSMPVLPVHHQLPEFTQTHVHRAVMPSSHLILCCPLFLLPPIPPSIRVFSNESTLCMRWPSTGISALALFLPKNTKGWSPLEWTGWISLQSKGLSRVFSSTIVQKLQVFSAQLSSESNSHIHRVGDAIQPSHPLLSRFPFAPNPSQHQSLFQWVDSSHEVAKVLEFQLQHHSFQRTPRADLL